MVLTAHRGSHRCAKGNSQRLPESCRGSRLPARVGAPAKPAIRVTPDSEAKPAIGVTPDFIAPFSEKQGAPSDPSPPSASVCEAYRELIEQGLARGRNGKAIWQDLVSDHGFAGGYQAVKRFVRTLRGPQRPEVTGIILTAAGQEAQVDYGSGPMVREPQSGKYRRTRLFVLTLGYSRKSIRLLVWRSSARIWAELHEKAFRRLGGCPRVVVLDNLKEGVAVPDIYDPTVNPLFRDVLAHYGVVALPCRIQDPDRKGKVESGIGHTQRTPLKGMRFESLEEAQAYLDRWEERWADTRIHGTTKRQVAAMFTEEKPSLLALPLEPFRYYQHGERVVRILHPNTNQLLREHLRQKRGGYRIQEEDHPKKNAAEHSAAVAARRTRRHPDRQALPVDVSTAGRDGHPPHLGRTFPDEEIRNGGGRRCLRRRSRHRRRGIPLRPPLSGAPPAPANVFAPDRSPDPLLRLGGIAAVLETRLQQA